MRSNLYTTMTDGTPEIVEAWLVDSKAALLDTYRDWGFKASGEWAKTLSHYVKPQGSHILAGIDGANYTRYMALGRGRNEIQTKKAITKWVRWAGSTFIKKWLADKGLAYNPYGLAYKIATEGYKQHKSGNFIGAVFTPQRLNELTARLGGYVVKELEIELLNILRKT